MKAHTTTQAIIKKNQVQQNNAMSKILSINPAIIVKY